MPSIVTAPWLSALFGGTAVALVAVGNILPVFLVDILEVCFDIHWDSIYSIGPLAWVTLLVL